MPGYITTTIFITLIGLVQMIALYRFISKTNAELTRFLEAVKYDDFGQRFELNQFGAGFSELSQQFTKILNKNKNERAKYQSELQHLKAIVEHVPVPLISLQSCGEINLWNHSARRLFGQHKIENINDLKSFGSDFYQHFNNIHVAERRLIKFENDGVELLLTISASQVIIAGESEYLVSLQNIQNELDVAQLQAWQDLVRVLTHEIMNSITPVASLAKTAADLVVDAKTKINAHPEVIEDLNDVADAVNTVARRSDSLVQFVSSYRRLTRLPAPNRQTVQVERLFRDVEALINSEWSLKNILLTTAIRPSGLEINVDIDMFGQALINLLRNAEQAFEEHKEVCNTAPQVTLSARMNRVGKVVFDIKDNGPGISQEIIQKIFVPLFTTKREGSGVGLALTRQIIIAHQGQIKCRNLEGGGAHFSLTF